MSKPVTFNEALALLAQYFPQIRIESVEMMPHMGRSGGRDVFLVNEDTVFSFPRSEAAARSIQVELSLLSGLAHRLPVPIPSFKHAATGPDGLPVCAGYPFMRGEPLRPSTFRTLAADEERLDARAAQVGAFLTALHTFPIQDARACGCLESPHPLIEQIVRQNAAVRASLYPHLDGEEREFLNQMFKGLLWELRDYDPPPALCHGRLSGDHLLLSPRSGNLAGVIGWGDMTLGDPSLDFAWRAEYGDQFFRRVLPHYHCPIPEPEQFDRVVTYRCQLLPTTQMMYALDAGDTVCFQHGRQRLAEERQRAPISL